MTTTVFFDFDGVLTTDGSGSFTTCRNIRRALPEVSLEHIPKCYRHNNAELLLGHSNHADIWEAFCNCLGEQIDIGLLEMAFRNTPKNERMFEVCKDLKANYRLGVITDNSTERFDVLKKKMDLPSIFDCFVVSGEIGSRKDSAVNSRAALNLTGTSPEECVFIDNNPSNLIVPEELGFKVIFHDHEKNDISGLRRHLKECGLTL